MPQIEEYAPFASRTRVPRERMTKLAQRESHGRSEIRCIDQTDWFRGEPARAGQGVFGDRRRHDRCRRARRLDGGGPARVQRTETPDPARMRSSWNGMPGCRHVLHRPLRRGICNTCVLHRLRSILRTQRSGRVLFGVLHGGRSSSGRSHLLLIGRVTPQWRAERRRGIDNDLSGNEPSRARASDRRPGPRHPRCRPRGG